MAKKNKNEDKQIISYNSSEKPKTPTNQQKNGKRTGTDKLQKQ